MYILPVLAYRRELVYLAAALLPAIILMVYIYKQDRVEREPRKLLLTCVVGGCAAGFLAMIIETVCMALQTGYWQSHPVSDVHIAVMTAIMVGLAEEASKLLFLKKSTWKSPEFNYQFDGIVYAVFTSLGFAALENVLYVFSYQDLSIALSRGILSIPAHMSFAVYMGLYYGKAKNAQVSGKETACTLYQWEGYLSAVFLHAVYDGSIMIGSDASMMFFVAFVILLDINVIRTIRWQAAGDRSIY